MIEDNSEMEGFLVSKEFRESLILFVLAEFGPIESELCYKKCDELASHVFWKN